MSAVSPSPSPVFGKRNARVASPAAPAAPAVSAGPDHAAFFAETRREIAEDDTRPLVVPRSFRAAILAGLAVGFCLAGLDVTRANETLRHLSGLLSVGDDTARLLPVVILLALLGGARAAATNLLISHSLLRRVGWTGHAAYAFGGGAVAAGLSLLALALIQGGFLDAAMTPTHDWPIDAAAGAGAGFFYRVFAGARRG